VSNDQKEDATMAYAQWVSFTMKTIGFNANVSGATLSWGKFYQWDNKDQEVFPDVINQLTFTASKNYPNVISSCGREDSPSGTTGYFDLFTGTGGAATKVCRLNWDCPWGSKTNSWSASDYDDEKYIVSISGGSSYGGAIGTLTVIVAAIPPEPK
jgi:Aegerolysin